MFCGDVIMNMKKMGIILGTTLIALQAGTAQAWTLSWLRSWFSFDSWSLFFKGKNKYYKDKILLQKDKVKIKMQRDDSWKIIKTYQKGIKKINELLKKKDEALELANQRKQMLEKHNNKQQLPPLSLSKSELANSLTAADDTIDRTKDQIKFLEGRLKDSQQRCNFHSTELIKKIKATKEYKKSKKLYVENNNYNYYWEKRKLFENDPVDELLKTEIIKYEVIEDKKKTNKKTPTG